MQLFIPLLTAFTLTIILTPLTIIFAKKYKLVDDPKSKPHPASLHNRIVPKAGGIPIYLSLLISILLFIPIDKHILGILIGGLLLLVVGLLDDLVYDLSPYPRLLIQFLAAACVVASGVGIAFITNPLGGVLRLDELVIPINFFGTHNIVLIADIFAFFWIVWVMNMVNWSWGVDGQMPGIIAVACLVIGYLAFNLFLKGDNNQLSLAILAFITAGTSLGFLIFNWYPAKIFPGDSGSNILGFLIATLCILSSAKLAIALIVMLVPITDFFYTFFRRILNKKSPFKGDKKHLHHLLLTRGWTPPQISLFYIGSCVILGLLATQLSSEGKIFTVVALGILTLGAILWLHLFNKELNEKDQV